MKTSVFIDTFQTEIERCVSVKNAKVSKNKIQY